MSYGLTALKQIQISSPESAPGTAAAATEIVSGSTLSVSYADNIIHYPEQDRGSLSMHIADDFIVGKNVEMSMEGIVDSRLIVWLLANSIAGNITPTTPAPNVTKWLFEPALTTPNTPDETNGIDTFTMEFGDNIQAYEAEYCFTTSISFSGAPDEPVTYTADITARQLTETTFTPALSVAEIHHFPSNLATIYINNSWATLGTTRKDDLLQEWTWTLETQFTARKTASGELYFSGINEAKKNVQLEMTFLRGAASEAEKVKYNNRTTTFIHLELTSGTNMTVANTPAVIAFEGAFRYDEWSESDDSDGAQTETVTAFSNYDETGAKEFSVYVYNNMTAYPV